MDVSFVIFICFFKQKTAYDMRISDWSSDVCSSDLRLVRVFRPGPRAREKPAGLSPPRGCPLAGGRASRARPASKFARALPLLGEIGRAACRARVCQYV